MNPMSGSQNPAPPYTRPPGPNQQAQNSQYHQVNIIKLSKEIKQLIHFIIITLRTNEKNDMLILLL